jgi:putative endonuclease
MPSLKRRFGDAGEDAAVEFLKSKGYEILDRNYLLKCGEIDIVAAKTGGFLNHKINSMIFVEVKTASVNFSLAFAAQNVHSKKKHRLIRSAQVYLIDKKIPKNIPWQIDVVLISLDDKNKPVKIEHLENAVW